GGGEGGARGRWAGGGVEGGGVAQRDEQLGLLGRAGEDGSALAGRDLLVRVERQRRWVPVRAERAPFVARTERLAGVFDEREPVPVADRPQLVELTGIPEDVDGHDRARPRPHRGLDGGRIEVERVGVDVGEDRGCPHVDRAVGRGDERVGRGDYLVAGSDAGEAHAEVQARRAGRHGRAVRRADGLGEELLEPRPDGPEREPPGAHHLDNELLVALVEPRRGEADGPGGSAHAARVAAGTSSRHSAKRSLAPRTMSRYARWISSVISPTPISWSSTERTGVISAAVPHMKTSSARERSERISVPALTAESSSAAILKTESRVMPCRIPVSRPGVEIFPSRTTKIVSPGPSAIVPSGVSMIASS